MGKHSAKYLTSVNNLQFTSAQPYISGWDNEIDLLRITMHFDFDGSKLNLHLQE